MNELTNLDQDKLHNLNLQSQGDQWRIVWPSNVNIFHMTVGKHLDTDSRDNPAMVFEEPDLSLIHI